MSTPLPQTNASTPSSPHLLTIRTPRLILRTMQHRDASAQKALNDNPLNAENEPHSRPPKPVEHYQNWISDKRKAADKGESNFMVVCLPSSLGECDPETNEVLNDVPIGISGFNSIHPRSDGKLAVDVGVMIDSEHWRKGYGSEALAGLIEFGLRQPPLGWGAEVVEMQTLAVNLAFVGMAEKMGIGGLKKWSEEDGGRWEWDIGVDEWDGRKS